MKRGWILLGALLVGASGFFFSRSLATHTPGQIEYYNLGRRAYETGDYAKALELFNKSYECYEKELKAGTLKESIYPKPSLRYAALAQHHRAKALLQTKQAEVAVEAFLKSLNLNPGDQDMSSCSEMERKLLERDAFRCRYNLEQLFKARPDLAAQQGKGAGKGRPGNQPGRPMPGDDPGTMPGRGKDDI